MPKTRGEIKKNNLLSCAACPKFIEDNVYLKCIYCFKNFHNLCVGIASSDKSTGSTINTWECPDCKVARKRGGDNSNTPLRGATATYSPPTISDSAQNVTMRRREMSPQPSLTSTDIRNIIREELELVQNSLIDKFKHIVRDMVKEEIHSFESTIEATEKAIAFLNDEYDTIKKNLDMHLQNLSEIRK
ncbi:unnamed protein product [Parnassius mnemosyne]|uniref:Zinc finger PHD-type domain-containing protein n=1 Tax=Parnassius mnemosyne TaxID=213953 RepID=A0AAV1KAY7_9NEOP